MLTLWSRRKTQRGGFTLIELVVVVMIIGVLAAFAIPQLMRTMESTKADDAAGIVKMIGTANRMYFVDKGSYVSGTLTTACGTVFDLKHTPWRARQYSATSAMVSLCQPVSQPLRCGFS